MRYRKCVFILFLIFASLSNKGQNIDVIQDIKKWQLALNTEYKNRATSPLTADAFKSFVGHDFFEIDTLYRVNAILVLTNSKEEIPFKTSSTQVSMHRKYATLLFSIKGMAYKLSVYQSIDLMNTSTYADYLFLPFFDATTGNETYGAGRYIDLKIPPKGRKIIVDFNKSYNPYCAYSTLYSCPKVPAENELKIEILAGVKYKPNH